MADFQSVILAAGRGTRLKSEKAKVLHEVLGRPMIDYAVRAALDAGARRAVVVTGYQRDKVEGWLRNRPYADRLEFAVQDRQLGTAHAVWMAEPYLDDGPEYTIVQYGDVPLMDAETLETFAERTINSRHHLGLMTAVLDDPKKYGRVVRDDAGDLLRIVEYADATLEERKIDEINAGFYVAHSSFLAEHLSTICSGPAETAQEEYYLTELVELAAEAEGTFGFQCDETFRIEGVNTRADLAEVTDEMRRQINETWMQEGVTMIDPSATYVEPSVELSNDVVLHPGVQLIGETTIASGAVVENGSVLRDTSIGPDVHVKAHSYLEEATVDSGTSIGPSAHLRPGSDIGKDCKVGNYVEVKKSRLEDGVKAGHLTYLGDAHVGERANVGAGTITCNYDGEQKHRTEIGAEAFIGSNSSLVAPLRIGEGAYIGAGSTITEDVPPAALGIGRGRQCTIENWADRDADDS